MRLAELGQAIFFGLHSFEMQAPPSPALTLTLRGRGVAIRLAELGQAIFFGLHSFEMQAPPPPNPDPPPAGEGGCEALSAAPPGALLRTSFLQGASSTSPQPCPSPCGGRGEARRLAELGQAIFFGLHSFVVPSPRARWLETVLLLPAASACTRGRARRWLAASGAGSPRLPARPAGRDAACPLRRCRSV
jgi:hypothetical protein